MKIVQFNIIVIGRRDNSLVHVEMAGVELNARYYAQHPALKSVYGKRQTVISGKLFSSYRTLFELAQSLQDSKISDVNCSYEVLVQKEALFCIFLCVLSLSSVLGRFIHLQCDTGSLGRSNSVWRRE